jgi:hypothetical protein
MKRDINVVFEGIWNIAAHRERFVEPRVIW